MARRYWHCHCGTRNERIGGRKKCANCGRSAPKTRVPAHAQTLRDDSYEVYMRAAEEIHGVADESCCVCRKPRSQERRHDRDHGHLKTDPSYGRPRGLACVGCNRLMPRELDHRRAQLIADYLLRVHEHYGYEREEGA